MADILGAVRITLALATLTTIILVILSLPLGYWLATSRSPLRQPVNALIALPLVLPPTVLGFYLLLAFGPSGPGGFIAGLYGARTLAFSFAGLVIASVLYSLPFVVQPVRNGFAAVDPGLSEAASTLRAGPWRRFRTIYLPLARPGILAGAVLGFAHTIGEFGVILMIGGNIPGETRVLSIAVFEYVETLQWEKAHLVAGGLLVFSFLVILVALRTDRPADRMVDP